MSQADVVRSIKIKTNTLKRLQKEFNYYLAEKDKEQTRVDRLRNDGADVHDLKQAVSAAAPRRALLGRAAARSRTARPPRPAANLYTSCDTHALAPALS